MRATAFVLSTCLTLCAANQAVCTEAAPRPEPPLPVVQLDLGQVRPGRPAELPAPLKGQYKLQIVNRAPGASYQVRIDGKVLAIEPVEVEKLPPPLPKGDKVACGSLRTHPLGEICIAGKPCETDEARIRLLAERALETSDTCVGKKVEEGVKKALKDFTTWTSDVLDGASSSDEDWEKKVEVTRVDPAPTTYWNATVTTCAPETQLARYLAASFPAEELVVLSFDHNAQTWSGRRWNRGRNAALEPLEKVDFENSFTNKPRLFLNEDDQLAVFATNTNPLLFSTTTTAATEANVEDLENLQKLTSLLGGFLGVVVGTAGQSDASEALAESLDITFLSTRSATQSREWVAAYVDIEPEEQVPPHLDLAKRSEGVLAHLKSPTDQLAADLGELNKPRAELEGRLRQLNEGNAGIKNYLQLVESDSPEGLGSRSFQHVDNILAILEGQFEAIRPARDSLRNHVPTCATGITALREALRLSREPLTEKALDRHLALDKFADQIDLMKTRSALVDNCSDSLISLLGMTADLLERSYAPRQEGADPEAGKVLRSFYKGVEAYTLLLDQRSKALTTADDILAKRGDIAKSAGGIQSVLARLDASPNGSRSCGLRSGVLQVRRVEGLDAGLRWSKVRTEGFKLAADSPYKDSLTLSHPAEATANYDLLTAKKWNLDLDMALTYTEIADPQFTAVPESAAENAPKIARETDRDSRAGELALFATFMRRNKPQSAWSIGPQLGVGVGEDPAIFLGAAFGFGRWGKLSGGWSWQQVQDLARGLSIDKVIPGDGTIKTRDDFDNNYYVSLSITIDELPFFKAADE